MNPDEVKNLATNLIVAVGASWAASHGIDQATFSSVVAGILAVGAGFYSVAGHWNMVKAPENAQIILPK